MSVDRVPRKLIPLGALLVFVLLFAAGCQPLLNAPAGVGETLTKTFRYGPFTLGPGEDAEGSTASGMPRPSGAFGLKVAQFDVVEEDGTPVSVQDVHLHHIVMTTSAHQDQLCPGRRERFIASGQERTPIGHALAEASPNLYSSSDPPQTPVTMSASMVQNSTGGGQGHANIQPFQCINYIVALYGVYPSRS